jgi:hypothetical protein
VPEPFDEQLSRVRLMASGAPTWDLSENDLAALQAVLEDRDRLLRGAKHALAYNTAPMDDPAVVELRDVIAQAEGGPAHWRKSGE